MQDIEAFLKDLKRAVIVRNYPDLGRAYETSIMPSVKNLSDEITKQYEHEAILTKEREQAILNMQPQEYVEQLDEAAGDCVDNQIFIQQQMAVIAEMRLVYLYKSYEIELKRILTEAYPEDVSKLYIWNKQHAFFAKKQINLKLIHGYIETNELRIIVNNIKHGLKLDPEARLIPEFKNCEEITYPPATLFYRRVVHAVNQYISIISEKVFNSLYNTSI